MTELQSIHATENLEGPDNSLIGLSPVHAALVRKARQNFSAKRIARNAQEIEEWGLAVKVPEGSGDRWADDVWNISDTLKPYGLDISVRIQTVVVSRRDPRAWTQRR